MGYGKLLFQENHFLRLEYKHKFPKPQYGVDASKWGERKTEEKATPGNIFVVEVEPKPTEPKKKKFNIREWTRKWRARINERQQWKKTEKMLEEQRRIADYDKPKVRLSPEASAQIDAGIDKFLDEEAMRESIKEFDKHNNPWDKPVPYLDTSKLKQADKIPKTAPAKVKRPISQVDSSVDELHQANEAQAVVDKLK